MNFNKLNNIVGWVVFAIALFVYASTMERTVSLWDCGEYISTSNKLEVGHPPGAPLFNMTGRLFSVPVAKENVALSINFMSALCSAFTILFLFWSITYLARKMAVKGGELTKDAIYATLGSGVIGALAFTFSDSFWFSAVEGEVYAMSSFYTAAVVWATFKWDEKADEPGADRWLILIFFLIGLSIGVHLLNLLAIPAIAYVYYFRKFKKTTAAGFLLAGIVGMGILGFVQAVLIPGIVGFPGYIERVFKNNFGMPFNVGLILCFVLLLGLIVLGLMWTHRKAKPLFNTAINCFLVVCIGYSCFFMIPIRSSANTPIDENNPENPISFLSYLNREQYGSWPVLYGPYWNSDIYSDDYNGDGTFNSEDYLIDGNPIYMAGYAVKREGELLQGFRTEKEAKDYIARKKLNGVDINEEYFMADDRKGIDYRYNPDHMTLLPRMFSREDRHVHGYMAFSGYDPTDNPNEPFQDRTRGGKMTVLPTFGNNMRFLFNYQLGWMYFRYFMWNFAGRQNDEQGTGPNPINGNWISGVSFIDNQHVGDQSKLPDSMSRNLAYNKFFMLPLILGLIGFFYHFFYGRKDWFVILLLFVFTGIMIIIYLNPKPYEPRERDYAYAGSFYAFAFWIGLGVWALFDAARKIKLPQLGVAAAIPVGFSIFALAIESGMHQDHTVSYSVLFISVVSFAMLGIMMALRSANTSSVTSALVACLLGAPVPFVMAKEGWADHDRSNRTTALDFARNFLETCEPNAILFTHGDNDTFPLWYAQEVEEIRTDVRIVNLSLLGTDWYIDQMLRKAYKSDPVPFTAPEYMYRQGGMLDYVSLDASKNKDGVFLDLRQAMDYVMNDDNAQNQDGRKFMSIPSRTFSLKVELDSIKKYKVLPEDEWTKVLRELKFTVPKGSLYKNDLMILDLIAHNNWKRPVYFAGGADSKTYLGLDKYFQSEGLAYKLIPIATEGDPNTFGRVNVEKMYNNIMKVYKWGGMENDGVNVDFFVRHTMTNNYRLMFYTLAQELSNRGSQAEFRIKNANANIKMIEDTLAKGFGNSAALQEQLAKFKASLPGYEAEKTKNYKMCKEVIDKCFAVMPEKNVPYDRIIPSFVPILYTIGDIEGAHKIADKLVKDHYANFEYYSSLQARFAPGVMDEAELSFKVLAMMDRFASEKNDKDRADEYGKKFESVTAMLNAWVQRCSTEDDSVLGAFMDAFPHLFQNQQQQPRMNMQGMPGAH